MAAAEARIDGLDGADGEAGLEAAEGLLELTLSKSAGVLAAVEETGERDPTLTTPGGTRILPLEVEVCRPPASLGLPWMISPDADVAGEWVVCPTGRWWWWW